MSEDRDKKSVRDRISTIKNKIKKLLRANNKPIEEIVSDFSNLRKQVYENLRIQDKHWLPEKRIAEYETRLAPFVKEHPEIAEKLTSPDISEDDSFALVRGMVGAMKENPELSSTFLPKITDWTRIHKTYGFWTQGLDEFVKSNPNKAKDMLPLLEVISNNPPKEYTQKSTKEVSGGLAWDLRANTKDYFLLAEAVVTTHPDLVNKVDAMVGKFKKTVSLLDAISVDNNVNGGKISERKPKDWTYYHDCYMKACIEAKKTNMRNTALQRTLPHKEM